MDMLLDLFWFGRNMHTFVSICDLYLSLVVYLKLVIELQHTVVRQT